MRCGYRSGKPGAVTSVRMYEEAAGMRTLCDACEGAPAVLFCTADEAALCRACDDKVHTCNKLASRHVLIRLSEPSAVGRCDICETSPGDKPGHFEDLMLQHTENVDKREQNDLLYGNHLCEQMREKMDHCNVVHVSATQLHTNNNDRHDTPMIDLNTRPHSTKDGITNSSQMFVRNDV